MIEVFKIGFLPITLIDLLDICLVAYIIYKLYVTLRGTLAAQIFYGLLIVVILSFFSQVVNLKAISWLLRFLTDIWIIAFIILFQPEIRRILVILARNPIFRLKFSKESNSGERILIDSAFELSQHQYGALIVVIKSSGIRGFSEAGELMDAKLSKNLLLSIFYPRSPLHDGAVIVNRDTIEAARCTLPFSSLTMYNGEPLGMRHRAGIGISEQADVLSIIVSEETGSISFAENGVLTRGVTREMLRKKLSEIYKGEKDLNWNIGEVPK